MTDFNPKYFKQFSFSKIDIDLFFQGALRDLEIARLDKFSEVRFTYSYQALIKAGIALIAKAGGVKIRSVPGHHINILSKMSEILKEPDVFDIGNAMRMKRNLDFYGEPQPIGEKEANEYSVFVEDVIQKCIRFS